ncbi:hypothetical protein D3C75_612930 [compost metagenome]
MFMVNVKSAHGLIIKEQFDLWCVGAYSHINKLPFREIPVWKNMNHRGDLVIRPFCLINIIGILFESCGIQLTEIRVFSEVRGWLPDIVKSSPNKLSRRVGRITICDDASFCVFGTPASRTVP